MTTPWYQHPTRLLLHQGITVFLVLITALLLKPSGLLGKAMVEHA